MSYHHTAPLENPVQTLQHTPWKLACQPFRVSQRTWYVAGQTWVSSYLIDTGAGLILVDTGVPESLYLLLDAVYCLGYSPRQIKKILLSHAHFDHCGAAMALRQMTGAELYLSREDTKFLHRCPEEVFFPGTGCLAQPFEPDCFYDDALPVALGEVEIHTLLTPGHTPGCTSFFWQETDPDGGCCTLGMHGGVGPNTMSDRYYATSRGMGPALRKRYIADMGQLMQRRVDITLPSHPNQIEIMDRAGAWPGDRSPYRDSTVWPAFVARHLAQAVALEEESAATPQKK